MAKQTTFAEQMARDSAIREQYIDSASQRIADLEAERDRLRGMIYRMSEEMRRELNGPKPDGQLTENGNG